jgi:hypothetical protein
MFKTQKSVLQAARRLGWPAEVVTEPEDAGKGWLSILIQSPACPVLYHCPARTPRKTPINHFVAALKAAAAVHLLHRDTEGDVH